ncbi:MAG: helicase C-terminal domain-containing protein [Pseudomonadota bacterium]
MAGADRAHLRLAVREFAQRVQHSGDLGAAGSAPVSSLEGQRTHQRLQHSLDAGEQAEVTVAGTLQAAGIRLTLKGRVDLLERQPESIRIDEIKTSRAPPLALLAQTQSSHWLQLLTYAGLFALADPGLRRFRLRLRYVHPDTLAEQVQERSCDRATVLATLCRSVMLLAGSQARERRRRCRRDRSLLSLAFPYPAFRPQQRALVRTVEQGLAKRQPLLLEAATGLGKSLGVLFPMLRSLPQAHQRQLWYLTAKRTGRLAAHRAAEQLHAAGADIRWLELTARSQSCPNPELPCDPAACRFAAGFYDRVGAAEQALQPVRALTPTTVREVALAHSVCPHALTRRLRHQVDLVIADFNHALDPSTPGLVAEDAALLIDESHQLVPRARELLSARLSPSPFRRALEEATTAGQRQALRRCLELIEQALTAGPDTALGTAWLEPAAAALAQLQAGEPTLLPGTAVNDCIWALQRWLQLCGLEGLCFQGLIEAEPDAERGLRLLCLDPAPHIGAVLDRQPFSIRFSGSLTPAPLYQQQQGVIADHAARIASPYGSESLRLLIVDDLPVYWRQRTQSLPTLTALLCTMLREHPGTWLVGLPSFGYLEQLSVALEAALADTATDAVPTVLVQRRAMDTAQREAFVAAIAASRSNALVLVVQGGIFSESVDFTGIRLTGVCAVGVGLAPPDAAHKAIEAHYDQQQRPGRTLAFAQPAMERIVQLVGRLQRSPADRGIALLIDDRFLEPGFQQFFPAHWRPRRCRSAGVAAALADWRAQD